MSFRRSMATAVAAFVITSVPAGALPIEPDVDVRIPKVDHEAKAVPTGPILKPYRDLATWVDMYNPGMWNNPGRAVARMAKRGVTTLFLETSNWQKKHAIYRPPAMERFIVAAHAVGIDVVAWYVPSFATPREDFNRSIKAIEFTTADGQGFDSFALDIEATEVDSISKRNARLEQLAQKIRAHVGPDYAMGGITPDVQSLYWPSFPYRMVAEYFDVLMPMGYFSYRVSGMKAAKQYTKTNVVQIRERVGDPALPVHPIGGIAGDATPREVRGYVEGAQATGAIGGSFYDFPITDDRSWTELAPLARAGGAG